MAAVGGGIELPPGFDDHILALEGIVLMLNNGFKESEVLFNKFKSSSPLMSAGSSFVSFMQGLMTFEDEKLDKAIAALKSTQKLCNSAEDDLIDSFKNKFRKKSAQRKQLPIEALLQRRIIVADCYLYIALIHFIKQDITGYIKGGWNLRKAWKIYEKCYQQVTTLLKSHNIEYTAHTVTDVGFVGKSDSNGEAVSSNGNLLQSSSMSSLNSCDSDEGILSSGVLDSVNPASNNGDHINEIPLSEQMSVEKSTILRLHGAVCFGYGAFNLCVSLVPPNLLRIVNMMGFSGDRITGVQCLEVASHSEDMKAPFAMLSLLWYHTVVRPFFAVDGDCMNAGLPEAEKILKANSAKYPTSSLVLFFKGRVLRCECNIDGALEALQASYDQAVEQRELQLLCSYEIGWCCIMQMKWDRALENISRLKEESKWSVCYYAYLTALLQGAMKNFEACSQIMAEVPKLMKRKNNQLEIYVVRKAKVFQKIPPTYEHIVLLILEVLYLWSAFPHCAKENLLDMLEECKKVTNPCLNGLKQLLIGAIQKSLKNEQEAMTHYQQAAQIAERDYEDGHIAPFACYELALIMINSTEARSKGVELLRHCKDDFAGYDFENRLQMRIHATEQRLKEDKLENR